MLTRCKKSLKYASVVTQRCADKKPKPSALGFFENLVNDNLCGFFKLRTLSLANTDCKIDKSFGSNWFCNSSASCTSNESFNWRVWSWLRLNVGGRLNTCKSNGNRKEACFLCWRVADGWVMPGNLPDSGGQQLETTANTACSRKGKVARRYQMSPGGIS